MNHSTKYLNRYPDATEPATNGAPIDFTGRKILIVDDNPQNRELLQAYLEVLPCETSTANDGEEALASVRKSQPDIILLDIMMPRMSGFEVCRHLKNDPATRDIPIIMVTALNEVADIERGVDSGTNDFLSKPFNKAELLTRVKSLLRMRVLKQRLDQVTALVDPERLPDLDEQTSLDD